MSDSNECSFTIEVVGEDSNTTWVGDFKGKFSLSPRETLRKDQIRRDLLGDTSKTPASQEAVDYSVMLSDLAVHVFVSPQWWKDTSYGQDTRDYNLVNEIYKQFMDRYVAWLQAKQKAAEEKKGKIRANADKAEKEADKI